MKIKNRFIRRMLWEIRRHAIILVYYAIIATIAVFAVCFVLSLPEIIVGLFFGF